MVVLQIHVVLEETLDLKLLESHVLEVVARQGAEVGRVVGTLVTERVEKAPQTKVRQDRGQVCTRPQAWAAKRSPRMIGQEGSDEGSRQGDNKTGVPGHQT